MERGNKKCPLDEEDIDVIPENYHYANRCICFLCICNKHICPGGSKKNFATRESYKTDYKRSFSRPIMTPTLPKTPPLYHRNRQKMDLETEYRKKFSNYIVEVVPIEQSSTPQPSFKLGGQSQYNRDFPDWGPVDYCHTKRPMHPTHETKLKFQGKSSYESEFKPVKIEESVKRAKSIISKSDKFVIPLQTSTQRDYKKIDPEHFPKQTYKEMEDYVPLCYNPGQFKTVSRISYVKSSRHFRDPYMMRKKAMNN